MERISRLVRLGSSSPLGLVLIHRGWYWARILSWLVLLNLGVGPVLASTKRLWRLDKTAGEV